MDGCRSVTEEEIKALDAPPPSASGAGEDSDAGSVDVEPPRKSKSKKLKDRGLKKRAPRKQGGFAKVDTGAQARKLMTQQLEKMVSVAVQEKDASLTKKKCRLLLIEMFGESRVEEHKEHVSAETLRLVMECQSM